MALSTPPPPPPPPPDPSSTTTTTTRPPVVYPPRPPTNPNNNHSSSFYSSSPRLPSNPNPNYPQLGGGGGGGGPNNYPHELLYPVASSGRGYLSRPFVFPYASDHPIRPPHMLLGAGGGVMRPGVVKGIPVSSSSSQHHSKAGPPSASMPDTNGHKDLRDRIRDDNLAIVRERKVRIQDNASLYSLCRSWLRNGFPEETQPQYLDAVKSLPRPLPVALDVVDSPSKKEGDKEEEDEDEGSVENMSAKELLQGHIKRAKRVRSRLREERLQRITRYKTRLALLLPPVVDQHFKNDSAAPN